MRWTICSGQYGVLNSGDSRVKFRDSHELRLGVCYFPNGFSSSSYWKRMSYKAGVSVSTPYLRLKGQSRRGVSGKRRLGVTRLEWPYQYGVLLRSSPIARECVAKGYHGLYGDLYIKREVLSSETLTLYPCAWTRHWMAVSLLRIVWL